MSNDEWVYKYDDDGNRVGLVKKEAAPSPTKKAGMTSWYVAIENEVITREHWHDHHTTITPLERDMQRYELKALQDDRHKPFSSYIRTIQTVRYTEAGYKVTDDIDRVCQDESYIIKVIQKQLGSTGRIIGYRQIRTILQDISDVYLAADIKEVPVVLQIADFTRTRLRKILQKAS